MKILVANIGSTSFKFRLFDIDERGGRELAGGGADRVGATGGTLALRAGDEETASRPAEFADHGSAIRFVLDALVEASTLASPGDLDAVAFKAVMGGDCEPVCLVDDDVLRQLDDFAPVAPAHNPPYAAAMRMFREAIPDTPLVACFEPGFHRTNPERRRHYAVPAAWAEAGVKRYGFHGASHRWIATRLGELVPDASRIISCHLGGSSSICAIRDGQSAACSLGLSPQSGLPQGSRVGDLDPFALKLMHGRTGRGYDDLLDELGSRAGLAAVSGTSGDMRDIRAAADGGSEAAQLAVDLYATAIRDYVGAYLVELGGVDAIAFTGGVGQNDARLRADVCRPLGFAGVVLDTKRNETARGEARIDGDDSSAAVWVLPANEELIVARQAAGLLRHQHA